MQQFIFFTEEEVQSKLEEIFTQESPDAIVTMEVCEDLGEELLYIEFPKTKKSTKVLSMDKVQSIFGTALNIEFTRHEGAEVGQHGYGYLFYC